MKEKELRYEKEGWAAAPHPSPLFPSQALGATKTVTYIVDYIASDDGPRLDVFEHCQKFTLNNSTGNRGRTCE